MRFTSEEIPPPRLIATLRSHDLLPAILFVPSRRKCDEAATEVALDKTFQGDAEKQAQRQEIYEEFAIEYPEVKRHRHRRIMLRAGIASHHAGHIPSWKLLIEKMMSVGLLNAIFATSTVAAGVDFPARTVVIANADTRGNDGWRSLEASELQQMTGRAGRRGRDNVGFVVLAPSRFQNPPKIAELLSSPPDPLESKFRATYTSFLNLLDAFGSFEQVREIAEKSFAFRFTGRKISKLENQIEQRAEKLERMINAEDLTLSVADAIAFERLVSARQRLQEKLPTTRAEMRYQWLKDNVREGMIVSKGKRGKQFLLVMTAFGDRVQTIRDDGRGVEFSLSHIKRVYSKKYSIKNIDAVEKAFLEIYEGKNPILKEPKLSQKRDDSDEAVVLINELIEKLMPETLDEGQQRTAHQLFWETNNDAEFIQKTKRDIDVLRSEIWLPFENRAKVLDHFGYLDFDTQKVSEEGKWLADLRLDRPLHVGEGLKKGLFGKLETKEVAGLMAALAADAERDYGKLRLSEKLNGVLTEIDKIIYNVSDIEWKFGVQPQDELNDSAAAAAEHWANGMIWADLVRETQAEEGDLVRLLSRTGEALMQIAPLKDSNPEASKIARKTAEIILREPIR